MSEQTSEAAGVVEATAATTPPQRVSKERPRNNRKGQNNQDRDSDEKKIEAEFIAFMARLRKFNITGNIVYQINNYKEGVECTFRASKDENSSFTENFENKGYKKTVKPRKELTPEQLAKLEARREKRRAIRAKKFEERKAKKQAEAESSQNDPPAADKKIDEKPADAAAGKA